MTTIAIWSRLLIVIGLIAHQTGCGERKSQALHDPDSHAAHGHDDGHEDHAPAAASFKRGTGVSLTEETRQLLGVEVVDVGQKLVPHQLQLTLQVFGEKHRHGLNTEDHRGCDVHGSSLIPVSDAQLIKPGQSVEVLKEGKDALRGVVLSLNSALVLGEQELTIGVSNATSILKPGEFVPARIIIPRIASVTAVPDSAVLRTSEGSFVYVVNGSAYLRTPVRLGAEAEGAVEVIEGLLDGDQVVSQPVQTLWLIELRATKGGGHSH